MPFNFFRRRKEAHDAEATAVAEAEPEIDEALVFEDEEVKVLDVVEEFVEDIVTTSTKPSSQQPRRSFRLSCTASKSCWRRSKRRRRRPSRAPSARGLGASAAFSGAAPKSTRTPGSSSRRSCWAPTSVCTPPRRCWAAYASASRRSASATPKRCALSSRTSSWPSSRPCPQGRPVA